MERCIPSQDHRPKHTWISQQTWELTECLTAARKRQGREEEQRLHKSIRSQARLDKQQWLKERLKESEETIDARDKRRWIKRIRSDYKPHTVTLNGPDGKPTSFSKQGRHLR